MPKKGEDVEGEPVELELDEQLRRSASTEQSSFLWLVRRHRMKASNNLLGMQKRPYCQSPSQAITDKMSCTHIDEYLANLKPPTNGQQVHK